MKKILIINGPNLNMLGKREPMVYGPDSLEDIIRETEASWAGKVELVWYQSNLEGEIITKIQECYNSDIEALIINPGGYSHTSVAIYDALKIITIPIIEVHLSQIYARESFRHTLLTAKAASSIMSGFGKQSYHLAVSALLAKKD